MDFKNAVKALQIGKKEGKKFRLSTEFGKNPEEELPFPEYPRPQMRRENWTNLNGWWEYAFTETQKMPKQRDGKILVPFSPECDASGVKRQLLPKEYLWYFRTIQLPKIPAGKRLAAAVRRRGSGCGNLLQRKACRRPSRRVSFFFSGSYAVSQNGRERACRQGAR